MWLLGQTSSELQGLPVWLQVVMTVLGSGAGLKLLLDFLEKRRTAKEALDAAKEAARVAREAAQEEQERKDELENRKQRIDEYADLLTRYKQEHAEMRVEFVEAAGKWQEDRKSLVQEIVGKDQEITALKVRIAVLQRDNHEPEANRQP